MPRVKNVAAITMVLLPVIIMAIVKYGPSLLSKPRISSVSILPSHVYTPKQYEYMADDVPNHLRESLRTIPNLQVQRTPMPSEVGDANLDLVKLAGVVGGADALVLTTVTFDGGMLELAIEVVDPRTRKVYYNEALDSPLDHYTEMLQTAGDALKHVIRP